MIPDVQVKRSGCYVDKTVEKNFKKIIKATKIKIQKNKIFNVKIKVKKLSVLKTHS